MEVLLSECGRSTPHSVIPDGFFVDCPKPYWEVVRKSLKSVRPISEDLTPRNSCFLATFRKPEKMSLYSLLGTLGSQAELVLAHSDCAVEIVGNRSSANFVLLASVGNRTEENSPIERSLESEVAILTLH